ncbi:amyloid protein-binding protein 2-like isoform X2 [Haliotis rubra]|uniref:amyloid protein-binding protein 2-like isoform X2 n=1 Tax=Haliotis rubra TaxID=36100 RepID=UPI001EE54123|nr:amyloid protein-binding protein 2-like isoform X2 [Haliotis rubra]
MASACALHWVPDSLYNTAVSAIVASYPRGRRDLKVLPENVQFDIYYKLYSKGRLCQLGMEFSDLDTFAKVLKVNDKRHLLHHCFQALMDHGLRASGILADSFVVRVSEIMKKDQYTKIRYLQLGFNLGGFLSDAGWFQDSERVYKACAEVCQAETDTGSLCRALECSVRLLHVQNANCKYREADQTCREAFRLMEILAQHGITVSKSALYTECCALLFAESQYDEAYKYCTLALHELAPSLSHKAVVDVLRQCSKACVVKREFEKAEVLIKQAVAYAREHFGSHHPKYSDALLDYGFYLLNVDSIPGSVCVYQIALDIRQAVFGGNNLYVAIAHEDLAYASYVEQYSSGRFQKAKDHAEKAIEILCNILPVDHLLLSSSKRVKALILEEIAIDSHNKKMEDQLLHEAQDLHLQSLELAKKAFGENNVQTAKHYGNLGRLYQSMHRYKEAEEMHLKAIEIKERLLGPEDYEVALSVGHLASLYNYDMEKFDEAEKLYLRSIAIGQKLFGEGYSGLEYDYRGLLRLYHNVGKQQLALHYSNILQRWNHIRDSHNMEEVKPLDYTVTQSIHQIIDAYF